MLYGGSINQRLADRVAFLLGRGYEERVKLARRTKELYGERSGIVHQGEVVSKENLFALGDIIRNVILAFIEHDFESWPEFQEWERQQKYTVLSDHEKGETN